MIKIYGEGWIRLITAALITLLFHYGWYGTAIFIFALTACDAKSQKQ